MVNPQHLPSDVKRSSLKWKFVLLVGGLGALLVIGALAGASTLSKNLNAGTFGVPSDFPVYPAAALVGVNETFRTNDGRMRGYLRLSGHGEQTRIDIVLLK